MPRSVPAETGTRSIGTNHDDRRRHARGADHGRGAARVRLHDLRHHRSDETLAASVDGLWTFDPAGTGVRIAWQWTVHPASLVAELAVPLFGWLWKGYARQTMDNLETLLLVG